MSDDLQILNGNEIRRLLDGREMELVEAVRVAYEVHEKGGTVLPHSMFLTFPERNDGSRIIALPSYLGGRLPVTGFKWVSSFPANLDKGLDRASAIVVLNSLETGRPEAILEGSVISAKRTAASAALAAKWLHKSGPPLRIGVVGCGPINFEIIRFLIATWPRSGRLFIFDSDAARANLFKRRCEAAFNIDVDIASSIPSVLNACSLVSIATTASQPHIDDLSECQPGSTILHISLRDIAPSAILACDNVVDDVDHVCRAQTSIHLTEQRVGHRRFIRCSLGGLISGQAPEPDNQAVATVFSPFGLGILDLAVAKVVSDIARKNSVGSTIESFFPAPWTEGFVAGRED